MADDPKVRKCPAQYKTDTGELLTCGTVIPKGQSECSKKKRHILNMVTGFCGNGFHEGTRAKAANGAPAKVCEFWQRCPCQCHLDLDELYAMSGQPRIAAENPEYIPPKNTFWMPTLEERAMLHASSNGSPASERVIVESPMPDVVPATLTRTFAPTPTGRAGRGQLETWVKECCDEWIVEKPGFPCTPSWVANWIVRQKGVNSQSQGAVNAVFERWVKIGFAVIEKKPARFTGYTDEGVRVGLDVLKLKAKDVERRKTSLANKGIR